MRSTTKAALRRVAVLVASGLSPSRVFDAVSAEAGAVLDAESAGIFCLRQGGRVHQKSSHSSANPRKRLGWVREADSQSHA